MATKKQKRAAGLAKREAFLAEVKADGLKALARQKVYEAAQQERILAEAMVINSRNKEILDRAAFGIKPGTGVAYDKINDRRREATVQDIRDRADGALRDFKDVSHPDVSQVELYTHYMNVEEQN